MIALFTFTSFFNLKKINSTGTFLCLQTKTYPAWQSFTFEERERSVKARDGMGYEKRMP